jgi:hypothetical protein
MIVGLLAAGLLGGALFGGALLAGYKYAWLPRQATIARPAAVAPTGPELAATPTDPAPAAGPGAAAPAPEVAAATPPVSAPAAPTPAAATAAIVFSSAAPGTNRLTASCDGTDTSGAGEVTVGAARAESCVVRAVLSDRSRMVAEVSGVTAGRYTCFAGGAKTCTRD